MLVLTKHRDKYLSLFPALAQGKIFNLKLFREEFWVWKLENWKKIGIQQSLGQRFEKKIFFEKT